LTIQAIKDFPVLSKYEENWGLDELVKASLKYWSTDLKKKDTEMWAAQVDAFLHASTQKAKLRKP
jgi:hypothetical protein